MDVDAGKINDDSLEDISDEDELEGEEAEFSSDDDDSDNDDDEDDGDDDDDEEDDGAEEGDDNDDESVDDDDDDDGDNDEDWETEDEDALLEASDSEGGEETEKCPICLNRFREQDIGTPEACDHLFCLECIQEWAKNVNTCPVDRQVFRLILCKHSGDDKIFKRIPVEDRNTQAEDDDEPTYCEVCHQCDREDRLLLCDGCDQGYHLDCLTPPLSEVPVEEWFCPECGDREGWAEEADDYDEMQQISAENEMNIPRRPRRQIPRTIVAERVRSAIEEIRVMRTRRIRRIVSSEEEEEEEETPPSPPPAPSTSSTTRSPAAKKKTTRRKTPRKYKKRKTTRKRKTKTTRKRKTKKRKTTKTKTTTKTKRKGVKRKTRRKKRKVKKKVRTARPQPVTTVKSRIADSLGLCTPPKGTTIPLQKQRQERPLDAGADSLSIFGTRDELIGFHDEAASPGPAEARKPSKYSRLARSSYKPIGRVPVVKPASKPKGKVVETTAAAATSSAGPVDLLGSILQGQDKLHLHSKDITIQKDGSLLEKPKETFKSKAKPKISFSIGKSSPIKTPGSLFKTSPRVISPPTSVPKFDLNSKKGSEKTDKPSLPASSGSIGFQPSVCLNEEYDPAHPTDELDEAGATVVETKMVQDDDKYDPFHPTDELESDDDDKVVSDSQDDKNSALVDLKNKNHSKTSFSLNKTSQDDVTIQSAGGNYLHKDRLDVKNVFNEDDDDDEEFEAVSPEKDGDFDEAVNGKTVVVDDDDKSTDLEDEIEFPTNSDKVILINQEANNTSDKNKQDSGSDSHNTKHGSMSEKADTLKADSVVSYEKERRNEKEQNKTNKTPEKSMEFVKLSENKEIKEEKSVVPPKPGFHGGLPQVLLPQQLKVVAKANEKDKNKDVKNESSDVTKTDYTSKTDSKVKKAELPQKVAPIQMSLNVKKPQFRNRLLYGEIDFTEDVSYSESGFPQKFEVNMKRIEDAFKDTKLAEEKKDDVEIIEEIPKEKSSPLSDAQLKEDLTIEIKDESETAEDTERVEETVLDVKKGKAKKQTDIPVEYIKKVKDKKEKEIHVEYIKIVKDKKDPGKVDKKSNKDRKDDKKYDDTEEIGKKSKSKNRKDKSETTSKTEKENKSKKKSKRKVSIDDDDDVQEDEDELSYRKELKEIKEPKERKRNKDSKRHVKSDFSDEEEHQKGEKSKRSSDESKKSRQDKRKVREDIHDKKRVREDSYDRRKSREDSPDRRKTRDDSYDRRKSREDSYERRKSREDSHDRRKSREDSYERRKSREDSYDRKKHREYSYDRRKSREDKHDRKISREEDGYDYSDSLKTVDSHRKLSEDSKKMLVEYLQLSDDVKLKKDKRKKPSDEIKKSEEKHRGKGNEKNKTKDKHKKTNSEKLKLSNDYESISEDEILSDIDDKHEHWSEIEEGELQDDYWLKEKRKKDKRERKRNGDDRENRTMFYEETEDGEILYSDKAKLIKAEQEIDTRIVIQVSQNTENRRVWEEDEKRKKKRKKELKEKEEKRKERNKENEFKRDKKSSRHHRSRSRSKDHRRRSRSRERNKRSRSRSHDRPKKKRRDHSRSLSRDRLFRSRSRERSHERSSRKKRKIRDRSRERSWERDRSWNRSRESSESLDLEEIYGDSEKSWSGSPYRRKESPRRRHDSVESVSSIEKEDLHPTSQTLMGSILKQETGEFTAAEFSAKRKAEKNKTVSHEPETKKSKTEVLPKKKKVKPKPEVAKTKVPLPKLPVKLPRTPPKEGSRAESPIIILEDKEEEKSSESDDEPEETEQFSYTDRDEFLLQNKHKQQHTNLIQVVHTQEKPKEPASPAPPPGPDVREGHTPPVPVIGEPPFIGNQFPPPPPGPPPGMMIAPERPPVHVQASGPPGQSILSDGAILIRGLPPHSEPVPAGPQIIQNGSNLPGVSIGINVLPPGFPQGLPQPLRPQRPILVNAFMNQPPPGFPRLPGSPGPVQHIIQNPISSQIPSPGAQIPGPQVVGGPFDGLPPEGPPNMPPPGFPPGEPHHIVQIQTEGPPHNLLPLQHELEGLPLGPPPGSLPLPGPPEPQLIQITSNPHDPRLPIPLHLPPPSPEPPQHSVIVSGAPPAPVITSITPLQDEILSASIQGTTEESLHEINPSVRVETPPNSMAPVHIVKTPPPTASSIPGLGDLDSLPSVSGVPVDAGVKTTSKTMKDELPILSQLEEISKLLNVQAKLKIMSSQEKRKGNSPNSKNEDGVFKVPLPPGQKSGNNVTKEINEVTDMDMGSPIDEEGNIELPVSPQYENLIDKPEDLVDDIFSKKTGDDIFSKKTEDDIFAEKMGDDIFAKKTGDDIFPETRGDNVFSNKMGDDISTKKTDKKEDVAGDIFSEKTDKREAEGDNFSKKTDKNESVLDIFSNTSDKEDDSELEDIQDSFENKLDAIGLLKDIESLTRAINAETLAKKESDLNAVKDSEKTHKKDSHAKKKDEKSKHAKENRHKHHGSHRHHHKHKTGEEKVKTKDLRLKALTDAHLEIDSQEMPSSAVEMTNKEKYLQKLHLQERVVEEVKMAIKPHYASKDITKDQYKEILRKAVPKICHSKSGDINPMKIKSLIEAYVSKCNKSSSDKDSVKSNEVSPSVKANGERVKQKTNR